VRDVGLLDLETGADHGHGHLRDPRGVTQARGTEVGTVVVGHRHHVDPGAVQHVEGGWGLLNR